VVFDAPSIESGAPGIRRGLEWDAIEDVRSLRLGPKAEDGSDMFVYTTPLQELPLALEAQWDTDIMHARKQ
jgi:hypothetical protein